MGLWLKECVREIAIDQIGEYFTLRKYYKYTEMFKIKLNETKNQI